MPLRRVKKGLRLSQFYKELMYTTGCLEIEHGDANEGVLLLRQALEVDNAYQEPSIDFKLIYIVMKKIMKQSLNY